MEEKTVELEVVQKQEEKYVTFMDDRKARSGSVSEVQLLIKHGFDKHRFVSHDFLERNGLINAEEANKQGQISDDITRISRVRRKSSRTV